MTAKKADKPAPETQAEEVKPLAEVKRTDYQPRTARGGYADPKAVALADLAKGANVRLASIVKEASQGHGLTAKDGAPIGYSSRMGFENIEARAREVLADHKPGSVAVILGKWASDPKPNGGGTGWRRPAVFLTRV